MSLSKRNTLLPDKGEERFGSPANMFNEENSKSKFSIFKSTVKNMEFDSDDLINLVKFAHDMTRRSGDSIATKLITAGTVAFSLGTKLYSSFRETSSNTAFTLTIDSEEYLIYEYVASLIYDSAAKSISESRHVVASLNDSDAESVSDLDDELDFDYLSSPAKTTRYALHIANQDKNTNYPVTFNGIDMVASMRQDALEHAVAEGAARGSDNSIIRTEYITLMFPSMDDRSKFVKHLESKFSKPIKRRSMLRRQNPWGRFSTISPVPERPVESVILHGNQTKDIVEHVDLFLKSEKKYGALGIPWHTGILLHGPAGTGKSSIASMLASAFQLDMYTVSLSSIPNDSDLFELMSAVGSNSIVLFEDVDVESAATQSREGTSGVTKKGLLNVLDGPFSIHGGIAILTTNHVDTIQPELLRPGRVDLSVEVGYIDSDQLERMCKYFIGTVPDGLPEVTFADRITPADIISVFRRYIHNVKEVSNILPGAVSDIKRDKAANMLSEFDDESSLV